MKREKRPSLIVVQVAYTRMNAARNEYHERIGATFRDGQEIEYSRGRSVCRATVRNRIAGGKASSYDRIYVEGHATGRRFWIHADRVTAIIYA